MLETSLYEPVERLLKSMGYHPKAEIKHLDVFGIKEDTTVAVELKTSISLKLLYQAVDRIPKATYVYIAVPKKAITAHRKQMKYLRALLKRLNIGLIEVDDNQATILIDIEKPNPSKAGLSKKKRQVVNEFNQRENHQNVGGTNQKRITAYKEKSIKILHQLVKMKYASPKELKAYTGINETSSILMKNYEGWFINIERGVYTYSSKGEEALNEYLKILDIQ